MADFRFRLERVLAWRRAQMDQDKGRMKQLMAVLQQLDEDRAVLEESRGAARREILEAGSADGRDVVQLGRHLRWLHDEERRISEKRREQQRLITTQREALLESRRRVRLLEKLRDRRLQEWAREQDKETESLARDASLARWQARLRRTEANRSGAEEEEQGTAPSATTTRLQASPR